MDKIFTGDALTILRTLPSRIVQTCVTSPPYWGLRDYGVKGQLGLEKTPAQYVARIVDLFREVRRVLREDGTLWLNLGDCYAQSMYGSGGGWAKKKNEYTNAPAQDRSLFKYPGYMHRLKNKDLVGIPWRVALALQADGWYLRQDIIWHKPNPMPESVTDRCTKAHEYLFFLSKSSRYYFDSEAIKERAAQNRWSGKKSMNLKNSKDRDGIFGGLTRERDMMPEYRNRRSVWTVATKPYRGAHFATFPPGLIEPCISAGTPAGGLVLDPFLGSGTTAAVASGLQRHYIGIELNPAYVKLARSRLREFAQSPTLVAAE
jgi:DNA modification methylase